MTQTENEKELVLGNKQLVSFFFVVLALCGVFFALGYMIGRNSTKTTSIATDSQLPAGGTGGTVSPLPRNQPSESTAEPAPAAVSPMVTETAPVVVTTPAREASAPSPVVPLPAAPKDEPRETITPEPGAMYLQVTALRRGDAENLVKTLREQSFPSLLATSSKPDLFRVMVGPYRQTAQVADAKAKLKALGFGDAILKK